MQCGCAVPGATNRGAQAAAACNSVLTAQKELSPRCAKGAQCRIVHKENEPSFHKRGWAQLINKALTCVSAVSLSKKRATSDLKRSGSGHDCSSPAGGRAGEQRESVEEGS